MTTARVENVFETMCIADLDKPNMTKFGLRHELIFATGSAIDHFILG
jgi:hypothetical protein